MGELLTRPRVKPQFAVTDTSGRPVVGVETHTFRNGGIWMVALMTNPQLRVDELGPPEFKSNERFAKPIAVKLTLPGQRFVYDVRAAKALGSIGEHPGHARSVRAGDLCDCSVGECPRWRCPLPLA